MTGQWINANAVLDAQVITHKHSRTHVQVLLHTFMHTSKHSIDSLTTTHKNACMRSPKLLRVQPYYAGLRNRPWARQTNSAGTKHSFVTSGAGTKQTIMLNTDIALLFDAGNDTTINTETCIPAVGARVACPIFSAASCPVEGRCNVVNKISAAGVPLNDTTDLIFAYSDATSTRPSSIFSSSSSVGTDTWFPDFMWALKSLAELGYTDLRDPGVTTISLPNAFVIPSARR